MKTKIQKVLNLGNFFQISESCNNSLKYNLKRPSLLLLNNIYTDWLQSVHAKTFKHMPVFTQKKFIEPKHTLPLCYIENKLIEYDENTALEHSKGDFIPKLISQVNLNIVVPQQDITQYFIQWQRYRKYWWSSVS